MAKNEKHNTILIVDDNFENLRILKTHLDDAGYKVNIASNGADAIDRVQRNKPVLILLDVKMPGMDGFEVCIKLKHDPDLNQIPIVFVTASNDAESIAKGFEVGGSDYITKPVRKLELLARVKNLIHIVNVNHYLEQQIKERTQELQDSEKRYRIAIEGTQDGLWDWNLQTNEAFLSNRFESMLGYSPGELPQSGDAWLKLLHPDDKDKAMQNIQRYLKKEVDKYESTFRMKAKNGSYRWIVGRGKAEFDEGGNAIRIIGFNSDITERKEAELKIKQQNKELHKNLHRIKQINNELEAAKKSAEESNQLKTEFLNNMSHEIRTPMNGIIGFSEMLDNENISEEQRSLYIKIIQSSSYQLLRIINDILEISTLETKQIKINEEEFSLNDLLTELFSVFNLKSKENNVPIYLKKSFRDELTYIVTDKAKLNKILNNLIENALKFTHEGFIEVGYYTKDEKLILYVKDTGIGISNEKKDKIFARFTQENDEISKKHGGLGLGLSISKENAQLLGGDISLESEKGVGSTFLITIPFKPVNNKVLNAPNADLKTNNEINILIVEDEQVNFLYFEALFEEEIDFNYKLIHAKNGKEAVDICLNNKHIDIVLMDIKMPIMNGFTATEMIKEKYPNLPIIAQTAYATNSDQELALQHGCDDYISKPLNKQTLIKMINKYIKL